MIRNYLPTDAPAITNILNHYILHSTAIFDLEPVSEQEIENKMKIISDSFPCLVYEEDGYVAGFCYAHSWKEKKAYSHTLETTVYLRPGKENRKTGRCLMDRLIEECRLQGYRALIACITAENAGSIRFHERLGFRKVSHFRNVGNKFGRELDVIDMELILVS